MKINASCVVEARSHWINEEHGIAVGLVKPDGMPIYRYVEYVLSVRTDFSVCWPWMGTSVTKDASRTRDGYGMMSYEGNVGTYAHRLSFQKASGAAKQAACVMHICDHPWCINPAHLADGTRKENSEDMVRKGRHRTARSKRVSAKDVREMRRLKAEQNHLTYTELGERFGCARATASRILRGIAYKNVV